MVKPPRAATRRSLPTSPFQAPPEPPPAEEFAVQDLVTHDKFGLGRIVSVEEDVAVIVDFGSGQQRILTPCAKMRLL
jgi:hypothetical protein